MEYVLFVSVFTVLHTGASFVIPLLAYESYNRRGGEIFAISAAVLRLPLLEFFELTSGDYPLWLVPINSFVCASVIALLWRLLRGSRTEKPAPGFPINIKGDEK